MLSHGDPFIAKIKTKTYFQKPFLSPLPGGQIAGHTRAAANVKLSPPHRQARKAHRPK
jgi:hypothetical protein